MNTEEEPGDAEVVKRFVSLKEKGKRAIDILVGLPTYAARCPSVDPFVASAFDAFNELFHLQFTQRTALARAYNIKRWEIGEIAASLGQLHYYAYLRRGEAENLKQALSFYNTVQDRKYMELPKEPAARHQKYVKKKLRVLARHCLVCIHMSKSDEVDELLADVSSLLEVYKQISMPVVKADEDPVISPAVEVEVNNFNLLIGEGRRVVTVLKRQKGMSDVALPLNFGEGIVSDASTEDLKPICLTDALLVVNQEDTVKFSELALCTLRVSQALEYDTRAEKKPRAPNALSPPKIQKTVLYRATSAELVSHIASSLENMVCPPPSSLSRAGADGSSFSLGSPLTCQLSGLADADQSATPALFLYINANADEKKRCLILGDAPSDTSGLSTLDLSIATKQPLLLVLEGDGVVNWLETGVLRERSAAAPLLVMAAGGVDDKLSLYLTNPTAAVLAGSDGRCPDGASVMLRKCQEEVLRALLSPPGEKAKQPLARAIRAFLTSPFAARFIANFCIFHAAESPAEGDVFFYPQLPSAVLNHPCLKQYIEQLRGGCVA
ncbi:Protein SCAI-like protein [Diplonema papillatum]|nr:Protein SCAI-like protein [Diplonema papillatum]